MNNNLFSKCPQCGETIEADSIKCKNCGFEIASSFGFQKDFYSKIFLDLAVKNNVISQNDSEMIYEEYKSLLNTEYPEEIEQLLLNKKVIDLKKTSQLIAGTLRVIDKEFCKYAFEKDLITEKQASEALEIQKNFYKKGILKSAGDILKEKNILTDDQINMILKNSTYKKNEKQYKPLTKMWEEEDKKSVQNTIKNQIDSKSLKIAKLAVKYKFISKEDFENSISQWSKINSAKENNFIEFLESKGFLDRKKIIILKIHYEYENLREFDITFLKLGIIYKFIKEDIASNLLKEQNLIFQNQHKIIPVCDIAFDKKLMTNIQIKRILLEQKRNDLAQKFQTDSNPQKTEHPVSENIQNQETNFASKEEIIIEISKDFMKALLHPIGKELKPEDIKAKLIEKGIVFGIVNEDVIKTFIDEGFDSPMPVANGKPPVYPVNAEIKCHFAKNYLNVGNIDEEGNIDFMDRGEIPVAVEGQLLAEKIPLKQGKNGIDIFGNEIIVKEPIDCLISAGQGTSIDSSGTKVYASEKGQPHISIDGRVSVFNVHEINGDVDFHTGHIEFDGNIIIKGSIKPGFKVSGNDITAESATDAILNAKGHIEIKGGITGGKIFAQQGLTAKFTNQTNITSCGNINIEKEILESKIKTSGLVTVKSGKIISSFVSAKGGIDAKQIGTDISAPSTIEIGTDSYLEKTLKPYMLKLENINKEINDLKEKIESINEKDKQIHVEIAQKAQIQDKANQALSQLKEHFELISMSGRTSAANEIKEKIDNLSVKVKEYEKIMDSLFETQDQNQGLLSNFTKQITELGENKKQVLAQIESIKNFNSSIESSPVLIVHGTIEKGTKVIGPNSMWKVHETTKNIKACEITTRDQDGNPVHLIKSDKN
ncbi:MAG: FapA family protein [Desulforegulaceae bacterium]|nr:FapA family protein [Desulforegulaceae bacterium]